MANDMKPISYIKKLSKNFDITSNSINKIKNLKNNWTEQSNTNLNNIDSKLSDKVTKADLDAYSAYLDSLRQIKVNTPADGETITATKGDTILTQNSVNKQCIFDIPSYGDWTVKRGSLDEVVISVNELKQYTNNFPKLLSEYTWQEINDISEAGQAASKFKIGDEKDITLTTGETLTFQIYDFNHDDLADGSGKAGITFGMKNLMATKRRMALADDYFHDFTKSEMYKWLNGECFNSLPSDLKSLIKLVNKKMTRDDQSSSIKTNAMKLWIFSIIEFGDTYNNQLQGKIDGTLYPIFTQNYNNRIKKLNNGSGSVSDWWMRNITGVSQNSMYYRINDGMTWDPLSFEQFFGSSETSGVCFGFCI